MDNFSSGEVALIDLGGGREHEQRGVRPAVVVSNPLIDGKALGLLIIIPFTTQEKNWWTLVKTEKGDGGLKQDSFAMCHQIRCVSVKRVKKKFGKLSWKTLNRIKTVLANVLEI